MVDFRKNLTPLYYDNRGYVSIIRWAYFFSTMHRKRLGILLNKHYINPNSFSVKVRKKVSPHYYSLIVNELAKVARRLRHMYVVQ